MPSLPTPTKSWRFAPNISVSTSFGSLLLAVKVQLLTFGWTVSGSSDSVTAGMDGVDRWISSTNIVLGANSTANRGWIVLKNPAGRQLLLDRYGSSSGDLQAQGSGSALFTGGAINAAPTATDAFPTVANSYRPLNDGAGGGFGATRKLTFLQSTDGKNLVLLQCQGGGSVALWCIGDVSDPSPKYSTPFTFLIFGGGGAQIFGDGITGWSGGGVQALRFAGLAPSGPTGLVGVIETCWTTAAVPIPVSGTVGVKNQISNEFQIFDPYQLMNYPFDQNGAGRIGVWPDMWPTIYPTTGWATGDNLPADGSKKFVHFGDMILPWDGTTTIQTS